MYVMILNKWKIILTYFWEAKTQITKIINSWWNEHKTEKCWRLFPLDKKMGQSGGVAEFDD